MISVEMSDDIRKYETKDIGPFTFRQLYCVIIALIVFLILFFSLPISLDNKIVVGSIFAVPIVLCGYLKFGGLYLDGFLLRILYLYILTPPRRIVKRNNPYRRVLNKMKAEDEKKMYSSLTSEERKIFEQTKKKGTQIKYSQKAEFKIYR